jgi:hypothetical protein
MIWLALVRRGRLPQTIYGKLFERFDGRILGEVDYQTFLGLDHERDWESKTIAVSQSRRINGF